MKDEDQITAEARERIKKEIIHARRYDPNGINDFGLDDFLDREIKSAIEKATKEVDDYWRKNAAYRAAHAGQQWTVHPNGKNSHSIDYIDPEFKNVTELVAAHNATLQPAHASEPWTPENLHAKGIFTTEQMCDLYNASIRAAHASEVSQSPENEPPFVDTPLLAAKRKAFDNPTQENLDKLIAAAHASEQDSEAYKHGYQQGVRDCSKHE